MKSFRRIGKERKAEEKQDDIIEKLVIAAEEIDGILPSREGRC